jgi:hypothetical protein
MIDPVVVGLRGAPLAAALTLTAVAAAVVTYGWGTQKLRDDHAVHEARMSAELAEVGVRVKAIEERLAAHAHEPPREPPALQEPKARRGDPTRALLVVHAEWRMGVARAAELGRTCPDKMPLLESEIEAVKQALKARRISLDVAEQDRFAAMSDAELSKYGLVIHHNGGWGSSLDPLVGAALLRAHAAGTVLLFAGDDTAMMLAKAPEHLRLAGVAIVRDNGGYPVQLLPAPARDPLPVTSGPFPADDLMRAMGVLGVKEKGPSVQYEKEPDSVSLAPDAWVLGVTHDGAPVAWLRDAPVGVGVFDLSLRASDVCPVSSSEPWLRDLFLLTVDLLLRAR